MATGTFLASSVVMGLVAAAVFYVTVNSRPWKRYRPQVVGTDQVGSVAADDRTWIVSFIVLSLAAVGGVLVVLESGANATLLIFAGAALVIVGFLVLGTYSAARSRGHPHSHAVATTIGVLGGVVILAMVVNLLTQFGG